MVKKGLPALLALILTFAMAGGAHAAGVKVIVDGNQLNEECVIVDGRTLAPARAIGEAMGATVQWDNTEKKATISKVYYDFLSTGEANHGTRTAYIWIGKSEGQVEGGQAVAMDVPAQIINGKTMVPVKALGDMLAAEVNWDQGGRTVTVKSTLKGTLLEADTDYLSQQVQLRDVTKSYVENIGKPDTTDPLYPYGYNGTGTGSNISEGYMFLEVKNITGQILPARELYAKIIVRKTGEIVEVIPFTVKELEPYEKFEFRVSPIPEAYMEGRSAYISPTK